MWLRLKAEEEAPPPPSSPGTYSPRVTPTPTPQTKTHPIWSACDQECAGTGLFYAKAVVATDGEAITGVTIVINDTAPTVQEPVEFGIASSVEYLFGLFSEGQVYRVIGAGHIVLPTRTWLVTSADPVAAPGESPYDIYYLLGP